MTEDDVKEIAKKTLAAIDKKPNSSDVKAWLDVIARLGGSRRWLPTTAPGAVWWHYRTAMILEALRDFVEVRNVGQSSKKKQVRLTRDVTCLLNIPSDALAILAERDAEEAEAARKESQKIQPIDPRHNFHSFTVPCVSCGHKTTVRVSSSDDFHGTGPGNA